MPRTIQMKQERYGHSYQCDAKTKSGHQCQNYNRFTGTYQDRRVNSSFRFCVRHQHGAELYPLCYKRECCPECNQPNGDHTGDCGAIN